MDLGSRLRQIRRLRGKTQEQVASAIGVDRSTYAHWERNSAEPDLDTIKTLSEVLGTSMGFLFGETDDPRPILLREQAAHDDSRLLRADQPLDPEDVQDLERAIREATALLDKAKRKLAGEEPDSKG